MLLRTRETLAALLIAPAVLLFIGAPIASASPINMLSNPGFEGGVYSTGGNNSIPDDWTQVNDRGSNKSSSFARTGDYSASMTSPTGKFIQLTQTVNITAGQTYSGSVYLLNPGSAPFADNYQAYVTLNFNGTNQANGFSGFYLASDLTQGAWTKLSFSGTAGSNSTAVTVTLTMKPVGSGQASGDNRTLYWDDASLTAVPEPASALLLLGMGGVLILGRKRQRAA